MVLLNLSSVRSVSRFPETKETYDETLQTINSIQLRHDEFEAMFNMYPLLWFTVTFINVSGILLTNILSSNKYSTAYSIAELKDSLLLLYFIVRIDREKASVETLIAEIDSSMMQHQSVCEDVKSTLLSSGIRKLLAELNLDHTALRLFPLDRSLILNFVGALITFSVLFVQLAGVD
ncbi:hypothetical protein HDE_03680 [Halotydeus destructor]|nr:hypothetical protein HDE_03680 [Halotydeus destructor]